jgi:hydrogenase/urease accessory protein HupE
MRLARTLLLVLFAGVVARPLAAHPVPFSYLDLNLDADATRGALVVHDFDAAHELGVDDPQALLDREVARARAHDLIAVVAERLHLALDGRSASPAWDGSVEVLEDRQSLRLRFDLAVAKPGRIDLDAVLFPYDAVHQTFVNIYEAGRLEQQAILDASNHRLTWYSGGVQGRWAVVSAFVKSGIGHIMIGPDHLLFLLGLLLLGGSIWRLATIVTAFTLGHSVTLTLAALDVVRVSPRLVEPAIALSIVVVGVDNLLSRGKVADDHAAARDIRPWLAAAFGLIHGFGFAAVLREVGLPPAALGWSLAAFNVGVEIGQLGAVAVMVALLAAVRRYDVAWAGRFAVAGSIAVSGAGLFWFVQRVWFSAV